MSQPHDAIVDVGPVVDWLGLGPVQPEGLHGRQRKRLVMRQTRDDESSGGHLFYQALARAYAPSRDTPLLHLLRYQQLDDRMWRMIYAVLVQGGPVVRGSLIDNLARLTGRDRRLADETAQTLWQQWDAIHRRAAMDADDEKPARMGRPPKAQGEYSVPIKISLTPELAARLKADPDGPSAAVARMMEERASGA